MTPKDKARDLVDNYLSIEEIYNTDLFCDECGMSKKAAQLCALLAIDEIIKVLYNANDTDEEYGYWKDVKQEIEKL